MKIKFKCDYCGKNIIKQICPSTKKYIHHFCNNRCRSKWMALNWQGKNNPHYGKKWSKESKINMSKNWHKATKRAKHLEKLNKTKKRFGKYNPNWQDGISFEPYGPEFNEQLKEFIRKRDKHKCKNPECGKPQQECELILRVHHIDYDKCNNTTINLIALCNSCNVKANYNRPYWQNLYENIQIKRKVHLLEKDIEEKENYKLC